MQASENDLKRLLEMQEVDIAAINAEKSLAELPQREQLNELSQKKHAVIEKLAQVAKMHDSARRKVVQIEDEADILGRKREETQAKIDSAHGDFRAVQSLTRDLDGIAKRLSTLDDEQIAAAEKLSQVDAVKKQLEGAISALDAQALKIRDSFQHDAVGLKAAIDEAQSKRDALASDIDPDVLKAYAQAAKRGGGIGMALLAEGRCSTCRSVIDDNRLLQVKAAAPLANCPSCGRLLIVKTE
jgi:predicted  nucleic acid-binding Zn-ribbon protein